MSRLVRAVYAAILSTATFGVISSPSTLRAQSSVPASDPSDSGGRASK
jgi:hypothetical protein